MRHACRIGLWILLLGCLAAAAAPLNCDFCGKKLAGKYLTFKKSTQVLNLCMDCDRHAAHCAACTIPLRPSERVLKGNEVLCQSCAAKALYCTLCNKRIEGEFVRDTKSDTSYCQSCYQRSPKCAQCTLPFPRTQLDLYGLCPECRVTVPKCKACGKPVIGDLYSFRFEEGDFCESCIKNRPACAACGVPVGDKYWTFPDGRAMCNACKERGVIKRAEMEKVFAEARQYVGEVLGLTIQHEIALVPEELNAKGEIAAMAAKHGDNGESPLAASELGLFRRRGEEFTIFLLYGMPYEMVLETAAHELTHAWQAENCPPDQSDRLREGFAQWVAAQVLQAKGHNKLLAKLEARTDDPYGTGYQNVKRMVRRYGIPGTIARIQKMK